MTGPEDLDLLAAEYVIGTLDTEERTAFAARLRNDDEAGRAVTAWERRLAAMALRADPVVPSPDLWVRIERDLRRGDGKPLPFRVIEGGRRSERGGAAVTDERRSRDRWRRAALAASSVAALLLAYIVVRETTAPPDAVFVAAVTRGGDRPALLVRFDARTRQVLVHPLAAETPAGRSLELWYIGDGAAPRSMGVVRSTPARLTAPEGTTPGATTVFAVSVEPPGGSTTGSPTGPVVYSGQLVVD